MHFLTDFADQAVLLPMALVVACCLWASGWSRGAGAWLAGVGTTLTAMLVLKIVFIACGPGRELYSPSGHTAAAAVVSGGLMVVLLGRREWALPVAVAAACLIGLSRLAIGAHVPLEVLVGGIVGAGGAVIIARTAGPMPEFSRGRVAMLALLVVVFMHGIRMPAEAQIRGFAERVALYLPACQAH